MQTIYTKQHKTIVGSVNDAPYTVVFDAEGYAEVEDAVAEQLTSGNYGVTLIDEDGAEVPPESEKKEEKAPKSSRSSKKTEGSDAE